MLHFFSLLLQDVILVKEGGSLGFSIIGGTDHSCVPFGGKEPGIFISHVSSILVKINHFAELYFISKSLEVKAVLPYHLNV